MERSLCHVFVKNVATMLVSAHSTTQVQSMCFSAAVRHMMTCVHVRHMYENFISLTKALLPPYNRQWIVENAVCRFEEGCMLNQCATCKGGTKLKEALCKESKTLVTKLKCLDGREQQLTTD